ncbi:MAG: hypothetical protein IPK60_24225 [Sandaracinaceae bacterium]|nr:hypothetical protein [Sandaracinaceae bacterium]
MYRSFAILFCATALLTACGNDECPAGSQKVGERCIALDGGVPSDAPSDSQVATDAPTSDGPRADMTAATCTPACSGETPVCFEGLCRECEGDADCPDHSPLCLAHSCEPCSAGTCTADQALAEIAARACTQFTSFVQNTSFDSFRAALCAATANMSTVFYRTNHAALLSGRATYDASAYEACAAAPLDLLSSCAEIAGATAAGGDCYINNECVSRSCTEGSGCAKTCAPVVALHGTCEPFGPECAEGTACVAGHCEAGGRLGEPCVSGECAEGTCRAGTCGPRYVIGDTCASPGSFCSPSLYCSAESSICRAFHGNMESCDSTFLGPRCADGFVCAAGICRPELIEGDTCTTENAARCAAGTQCESGHCERIRTNREHCGPAPCALGLRCVTGRCAPLPNLGEACEAEVGCLRGSCQASTCVSLSAGASCIVSNIANGDALDPCGANFTCVSDGVSATSCVSDAALSESCGDTTAHCADVDAMCSGGHCVAACLPEAS